MKNYKTLSERINYCDTLTSDWSIRNNCEKQYDIVRYDIPRILIYLIIGILCQSYIICFIAIGFFICHLYRIFILLRYILFISLNKGPDEELGRFTGLYESKTGCIFCNKSEVYSNNWIDDETEDEMTKNYCHNCNNVWWMNEIDENPITEFRGIKIK